jgi:hypothetical protein
MQKLFQSPYIFAVYKYVQKIAIITDYECLQI